MTTTMLAGFLLCSLAAETSPTQFELPVRIEADGEPDEHLGGDGRTGAHRVERAGQVERAHQATDDGARARSDMPRTKILPFKKKMP